MRLERRSLIKGWVAGLAALALVASCQAMPATVPSAPTSQAAGASFAIDAAGVVDRLANKPNTIWQDGLFTMKALRDKRQAKGYRVKATGTGTISNSVVLPAGAVSTSAPAYAHTWPDWPGPAPQATDRLYVITDGGTLYAYNPSTLAVVANRAGLGAFSGGAVLLSSDNKDVYLLSTGGTLYVLDATTLATRATATLSGAGFAKTAPFIDYATSSVGAGSHDDIWVVANDGTINRVVVDTNSGTVASNTNWSAASIGYGGAVTINAAPIVWGRKAYFGSTGGQFYVVDLNAAPSVKKWDLTGFTTATGAGRAITAAVAVDFDASMNINTVFVPCGDRVVWIDPIANAVTSSISVSLDKTAPTQGSMASYTPTSSTTKSYTSTDFVSIKTLNTNPSRWGGSVGGTPFNTGVQGTSVKYSANGGSGKPELWTANYSANTVTRASMVPATIGAPAVSTAPNEVCVDSAGNCWVACASGRVNKVSPTGAVLVNVPLTNALWPEVDAAGNCWVTRQNSNSVTKLNSAGGTVFSKTVSAAFAIAVDPNNDAWVTTFAAAGKVTKVSSTGTVSPSITVGSKPAYIARDPITGNLWVANNGASSISIINPTTGLVVQTITGLPANLWAVNFDFAGNPWTCHLAGTSQFNKLNRTTGAVVASYNMSAYGNCYEACFDLAGNGYVATDNGIIQILQLGNLSDIFGGDYYNTAGDGDDSYGFLKFKVPVNAFTNFVPTSSNLTLTSNLTTGSVENWDIFDADVLVGGGTSLWTGYPGTPNVDWNNRPAVDSSLPLANNASLSMIKDTAYSFPMPAVLADQVNSPDAANAQYAFALQSHGKPMSQVGHWYSNLSAGGTTGKYPTLNVTLANTAKLPASNGLQCQPAVDPYNQKVYIMSCNALYELDYSSRLAFMSPAKTVYNLSQIGRSFGPITAAPKTYIFPKGNVLITANGRVVAPDFNSTNSKLTLNNYLTPLNAAVDKLNFQVDSAPGGGSVGMSMLYDFTGGNVYLTTSNGAVIRANILQ